MRLKLLASCILLSVSTVLGHAKDPGALQEIEKERIRLLEEIVELLEVQYDKGSCSMDEVIKAKVSLSKLQRDIASDEKQKRQFQTKIIEFEKWRLSYIQELYKAGREGGTMVEVMRAKDRHLAAQQRLLKMNALIEQSDEVDTN